MTELILNPDEKRYTIYPIQHQKVWEMYKNAQASFWTVEEVDLSKDMDDWNAMSDDERHFIKHVLAFFAASDGIVNENLAQRLINEVQIAEAKCFYGFQIMIENVHSEMYSLLIDTYIKDDTEKSKLLNAIDNIPCVSTKATWALKWIGETSLNPETGIVNVKSFARRLIAFAAVEGIFFSASFASIYWLKKRGKMPGLTFSNELISRDEGMHQDFACLLYSMMDFQLEVKEVHDLIKEAVAIETEFITDALPCKLIGMNADLMVEYIRYVADRLCLSLNCPKIWNAQQPFDFMETISMQGKTNFFERRVGDYSKSGVGLSQKDNSVSFDEDF